MALVSKTTEPEKAVAGRHGSYVVAVAV